MKPSPSLVALPLVLCACVLPPIVDGETGRARDDVHTLLDRIASDVAASGPTAWLEHFLPSRSFFMAADGVLLFRQPDEAVVYLRAWAETVGEVRLAFDDVRIEVLDVDIAAIGAAYEEEVYLRDGTVQRFAGYFSGVAVRARDGWRLEHVHWSSPPPAPAPAPPDPSGEPCKRHVARSWAAAGRVPGTYASGPGH